MIRIPTHRAPTHPGEMLWDEFLLPMNLSLQDLSQAIYISTETLQAIVQQQQPLTPSLAVRLAKYLGTSADFWMNLQQRWDLYHALRAEAETLERIERLQA